LYNFDSKKFIVTSSKIKITVTRGQLDYEIEHLQSKLKKRDAKKFKKNKLGKNYDVHPVFKLIEGGIEDWE
jgi:hypothetical protein